MQSQAARPALLAIATAIAIILAVTLATPAARAQHSVTLNWTASTDAAANPSLTYNVYRSSTCTGTFAKRNASPVAATSYVESDVLPGSYCYQVTSVLSGAEGAPSNQAAVLIPASLLPQQSTCAHRGSLAAWLRCVASVQHTQPKRGKPAP
jgi:hypothetical protein